MNINTQTKKIVYRTYKNEYHNDETNGKKNIHL